MALQSEQLEPAGGAWEIDIKRRKLLIRGDWTPLGARAFEIMAVLSQAAGELVTKDDLMNRVWPGAIVSENSFHAHISAIRKALGPDRRLLKTVSGRGYRLLGLKIRAIEAAAPSHIEAELEMRSAPRPLNNLPHSGSALVGRAAAVRRVIDLVSAHRAVTLIGPGGIGKTRLALEVAHSLVPDYHGDAWLVEFASLSDPTLVPSAVAATLGLKWTNQKITPALVAAAIGERRLLLLLDNCEHVIEAAAAMAEVVVRTCPRASLLATSRELLRIDGEHAYRVPLLDVPPASQLEPITILEHSSVQLFISGARTLRVDFAQTPLQLVTVASICRRLEGLPLAIEFAAAHAATFGADWVLAQLDGRFRMLRNRHRTALPRHQTLRATLDWSYDLLPKPEQRLLRHLSVFVGGFTIEAAAAVVDDGDNSTMDAALGIGNLVTKSLVNLHERGPAARWALLETIREYAFERLVASGEDAKAQLRHAAFFRDLFAPAITATSETAAEDMDRYVRELHNSRASLDWAFSKSGDVAIGVVLTAHYVPVWLHLSLMVECRERIEQALNNLLPDSTLHPRFRLQLNAALGIALMNTMAMVDITGAILENTIEIAESLGDANVHLRALWAMWTYHSNNGNKNAAVLVAKSFSDLAHRGGDPANISVGHRLMANTLHYLGNHVEAGQLLTRVLGHYDRSTTRGDRIWFHYDQRVLAQGMFARVLWMQGLGDQAMQHAKASLEDALTTDHKESLCYALGEVMSPIAMMAGHFVVADEAVTMLIDVATKHGLSLWLSLGRSLRGHLLIRRGDPAKGSALLQEALDIFRTTGRLLHYLVSLGVLAEGLAAIGRTTDGLTAIDQALARSTDYGERWCLPEHLRIKGELLLLDGGDHAAQEAERYFLDAISEARSQRALFWELRVTLSLAGLQIRQNLYAEARQEVNQVYQKFTEGFDTMDLQAARTLLGSL